MAEHRGWHLHAAGAAWREPSWSMELRVRASNFKHQLGSNPYNYHETTPHATQRPRFSGSKSIGDTILLWQSLEGNLMINHGSCLWHGDSTCNGSRWIVLLKWRTCTSSRIQSLWLLQRRSFASLCLICKNLGMKSAVIRSGICICIFWISERRARTAFFVVP